MLLTARYVLPVSDPFIEYGAVRVQGSLIADIGTAAELRERYPDDEVVDYGLAALCPGFIDTHTHLEYSVMRGLIEDAPYSQWKHGIMQREGILTEKDRDDSALLGALDALSTGITTVADITDTGASARAVSEAGLRAIVYREVETMDKHKITPLMEQAHADIESWRSITDASLVQVGIAPHSVYSCHPELFRQVASYASDGTPVALHLAGSFEEYQFVKYGSSMLGFEVRADYNEKAPLWLPTGVSPVRYVLQWDLFEAPNVMAVHCTQVDADDIEILADYDIAVSHCPRCNSMLGMGIAPLQMFFDAKLRVGLGTDSPAASNAMDFFEEMRIGLLVQRAAYGKRRFFSTSRFHKLATHDAASALGILNDVGSLEVGKKADIIAVNLSKSAQIPTHQPSSALVHTSNKDSVMMTMIAGRVVYEKGDWKTLDVERLAVRSEEMREKLRS